MIDIENELFTTIKEELEDINVTKEYTPFVETLPLITFMCIDNYVDEAYRDSNAIENFAIMTFEVNAYSNKEGGKLEEAKTLIKQVDDIMSRQGFARTFYSQTPNIDETVARMTTRYTCRTDGNKIYRR